MSDTSVIGLGLMGSAIAQALIRNGYETTVWNRTTSRMKPLADLGATPASAIAEAVTASPVVCVCIDSYQSTHDLLGLPHVASLLAGRTLIQLSTGTPGEAREAEVWFQGCGCSYIDAAIMAYPGDIGRADATILSAGQEGAYRRSERYLRCLGGDLRYLGPRVGAAAALDLALLSYSLGTIIGAVHGAVMCESEGIGVDIFGSMFTDSRAVLIGEKTRRRISVIHSGHFNETAATLATWKAALDRIRTQASDADINGDFPNFLSVLFERAADAGLAPQDVSSLVKVLRANVQG